MDPRTESFRIEQSLPLVRLDTFLHSRYPAVSRTTLRRLIETGHITVNGQVVKPTHRPRAGELVTVHWPEPKPAHAQPEPIPLDILYEDEHLLVLNKPAGMVVHPSVGHEEHTLVNALLQHCHGQLSGIAGVARPGIVHRLDRETSGCLVVAKDDSTHLALSAQFAARTVHKLYHAVVCGQVPHATGEIHAPIARHPTHRKRMAVGYGEGRDAWTSYRVLQHLHAATYLQATIHTGRTHQIRVHFQHLGYPIVGDRTYGARQNRRLTELTGYQPPRLLLHALELTLTHPHTGQTMTFEAPLPHDFLQALQALRLPNPEKLG
jgi:23S rRNA pseudouridine1911/1915/1917 synthase